jgi:hypothetical protein
MTKRAPISFAFHAITLFFVLPVAPLFSQTLTLARTPYVERFIANPEVAGNLVVGLQQYSNPDELFDPYKIYVEIPPDARGHALCVTIATEDGLYKAQNLYKAGNESPIAQLDTEHGTNFRSRLQRYHAREVAVLSRLVDDCNTAKTGRLLIAGVGEKVQDFRDVVMNVNLAPDQIQNVRILDGKLGLAQGTCSTIGPGPHTAFTSSCEFKSLPPEVSGEYREYKVELAGRESFQTWIESFSLLTGRR